MKKRQLPPSRGVGKRQRWKGRGSVLERFAEPKGLVGHGPRCSEDGETEPGAGAGVVSPR